MKIREYETLVEELSVRLAGLEEEKRSLELELLRFQARYTARLGSYFLYKDMLEEAIAREEAEKEPTPENRTRARDATERARENREGKKKEEKFSEMEVTPELKAAYRKAMQAVHPDRATDEDDRLYRTGVSAEINAAYARGDEEAILKLLGDFQLAAMPDNAGKRLVMLIRQEHDLRLRAEEAQEELENMKEGDLATMREAFAEEGEGLFDTFAEALVEEIVEASRKAAMLGLVPSGFTRMNES